MRGVRSDHKIFELKSFKNGSIDFSQILQQFLNNISEHFLFYGYPPYDPSFTDFLALFGLDNPFSAGGGSDLTPHPKSSIFIPRWTFLGQNHSKLNFQQLLFSSSRRKSTFWTTFGCLKSRFSKVVRSDPPPARSPYIRQI